MTSISDRVTETCTSCFLKKARDDVSLKDVKDVYRLSEKMRSRWRTRGEAKKSTSLQGKIANVSGGRRRGGKKSGCARGVKKDFIRKELGRNRERRQRKSCWLTREISSQI